MKMASLKPADKTRLAGKFADAIEKSLNRPCSLGDAGGAGWDRIKALSVDHYNDEWQRLDLEARLAILAAANAEGERSWCVLSLIPPWCAILPFYLATRTPRQKWFAQRAGIRMRDELDEARGLVREYLLLPFGGERGWLRRVGAAHFSQLETLQKQLACDLRVVSFMRSYLLDVCAEADRARLRQGILDSSDYVRSLFLQVEATAADADAGKERLQNKKQKKAVSL
jgi:hypothetical protein